MTLDDEVLRWIGAGNPVAILDTHAHETAEAVRLREQILSGELPAPRRGAGRRPSKPVIAAVGMAGILVVGGVAAAAGLIPRSVTRYFESVSPPGATISRERLLVERVSPTGIHDQIWVARNSAGQRCQEIRSVSADGRVEDASVGCESSDPSLPKPPPQELSAGFDTAGKTWPSLSYDVIVHTILRDAARIDIVYPDGREFALTLNRNNGWAICVVPPAVTTSTSVVVVRDGSGTIIARRRMPATTH